MTTTPSQVTDVIVQFCQTIDKSQPPQYVEVKPEAFAVKEDCYINVQKKVERDGGKQQFGWIIWETPLVMLEAEFHSVWVSLCGDLFDVTPKPDMEESILFLPDFTRTYQGAIVDNIRHPLTDDLLVAEYIRLCERRTSILGQYMQDDGRPGQLEVTLPNHLASEIEQIEKRLPLLQSHIARLSKAM